MKRIISILLVLVTILCLSSCGKKSDAELKVEDIHAICELATIKCYYNNVAQIDKKKDNIFQKDRKMWIEYEGEAVLGIDMSKLEIKINDDSVDITMPKAEILSIQPKKETLNEKSYVASADGFLFKNKITTEDQEKAITKGQTEMENAINSNPALFTKAENKAKELIENYITKLSEIIDKDYTINWK